MKPKLKTETDIQCVYKKPYGVNRQKSVKVGKASLLGENLWLFQADGSDVKVPVETHYLTFI